MKKSFGSDNHSGVHPRIMAALAEANVGHMPAYGDDLITKEAERSFKRHFGANSEVFFVFNGTGANVLCVQCCNLPIQGVVLSDVAHMNQDECGAPERFTGCKLLTVHAPDGKLHEETVAPLLARENDQHRVTPGLLSLTEATECGTLYTPDEIRALARLAHSHGMYLHMDGARLAPAAAGLDLALADLTANCGVDILSFGGTKNGLMFGEAVVVFNPTLARHARHHRKQAMQLASKMRYIAAQFQTYLDEGLWLDLARSANRMAAELAGRLTGIKGVKLAHPVQCNEIFVAMAQDAYRHIQEKWHFYVWDEARHIIRLVTSFDTTLADIEEFISDLRR